MEKENKRRVKAAVFLPMDFEEMEAIGTIDILRRGGVEVEIVSLINETGRNLEVTGAHGIKIKADKLYFDIKEEDKRFYHALIMVGGAGTKNYTLNTNFLKWIGTHFMNGGLLCAICAAPALLAEMGLTKNRHVTCYPSFVEHMKGAEVHPEHVVIDRNLITAGGPASTFHFGIAILHTLAHKIDPKLADKVANQMLLNGVKMEFNKDPIPEEKSEEKPEENEGWETN